MKKLGNYVWGIIFLALGTIFALNAFEITNINIFFDGWWTLILIIPSLIGIIKNENFTANMICLTIGVFLLLVMQNIIAFEVIGKLIIPAIFLIIGINILFKEAISKNITQKIKEINTKNTDETCYNATFSGEKVVLNGDELKSAKLEAVFGGVDFDAKNASVINDAVINASAIFGGIDIILPANVNVKVKSNSLFGGVDNKNNQVIPNAPTVYINAFCMFGGVEIK